MKSEPTGSSSAPAIDEAFQADIKEWQELNEWMAKAKPREMELREKIAKAVCPTPKEGVNRIIIGELEFIVDHKINRKLDAQALDAVMQELPEDSVYREMGVLIDYKPALVLKGFRSMPDEQKHIFCQALTETPGAPTLAINPVTDAMDPATAPAVPDYPARVQTPIMDKYHAEKAKGQTELPLEASKPTKASKKATKPTTANGKSRKPAKK